jgi:hypothetical protein
MMFRKSLAQKLLFRIDAQVLLVNEPERFRPELGTMPKGVRFVSELSSPVDRICFFIRSQKELEEQLPTLVSALNEDGVLWVFYPKNNTAEFAIKGDTLSTFADGIRLKSIADFSVDAEWRVIGFQYKAFAEH